jgi:hypothetical protein
MCATEKKSAGNQIAHSAVIEKAKKNDGPSRRIQPAKEQVLTDQDIFCKTNQTRFVANVLCVAVFIGAGSGII